MKDVDAYEQFIPWITRSKVFRESLKHVESKGNFNAETKIGFSALSFAYTSKVSYEDPSFILSESSNSRIFESLHSKWRIVKVKKHVCRVDYDIRMTFTNSLYTSITNQFFDYLAKSINKCFEERCYNLYYKDFTPSEDSAITHDEEKPLFLPEDLWVWDLQTKKKSGPIVVRKYAPEVGQESLSAVMKSLKELHQQGYFRDLDVKKVRKAIE